MDAITSRRALTKGALELDIESLMQVYKGDMLIAKFGNEVTFLSEPCHGDIQLYNTMREDFPEVFSEVKQYAEYLIGKARAASAIHVKHTLALVKNTLPVMISAWYGLQLLWPQDYSLGFASLL